MENDDVTRMTGENDNGQAGPVNQDRGTGEGETAPQGRTFTQAELDGIVAQRLARAKKDMPDEAELAQFRSWKESQQTEKEKLAAMRKERDTARSELASAQAQVEQYEREKLLLNKGISPDDVDYYAFKIGKMVTEGKTFAEAAVEYLSNNPKAPGGNANGVKVSMQGSLEGGNQPSETYNAQMNRWIRGV